MNERYCNYGLTGILVACVLNLPPVFAAPQSSEIIWSAETTMPPPAGEGVEVAAPPTGYRTLSTFKDSKHKLMAVAISPDGSLIAGASRDGKFYLWTASNGRLFRAVSAHERGVNALAFSRDSRYLVTGGYDGAARVWDVRGGSRVLEIKNAHKKLVTGVDFFPDGRRIVTVGVDRLIIIWDAATGKRLAREKAHGKRGVYAVAVSPDGSQLVTGGRDEEARVWSGTDLKLLKRLKADDKWVRAVAYAPNGRFLVTGGIDAVVRIWDTQTFANLASFSTKPPDKKGYINSIAVSPDSRRIATGSQRDLVKVWDAASHRNLQTLRGHTSAVFGVAFNPRNQQLVSVAADRLAKVWGDQHRVVSKPVKSDKKQGFALVSELVRQRMASSLPPKPVAPKLVKSQYESTYAFQRRVAKARADYQNEVSEYNRKVSGDALTTEERDRYVRESFLQVFGAPVIGDIKYDADTKTYFIKLLSDRPSLAGDFTRTVAMSKAIGSVEEGLQFEASLRSSRPVVRFAITRNGVSWRDAHVEVGQQRYAMAPTDVRLKDISMETKVASIAAPIATAPGAVGIKLEEDPEIARLRKQLDRARHDKAKENELERLREQLAKMQESQYGSFDDDLPVLLDSMQPAPVNRKAYLFVVGIEEYDETAAVPFANRSAALFRDVAKKRFGIPNENVVYVNGAKATGTRLKRMLSTTLNRIEPGDTIYFYYTGHGVPARTGGGAYILPTDGGIGGFEDPKLELNNLYRQLARSGADKVVVFVDACFSGQIDDKKLVFEGVAPAGRASRGGVKKAQITKERMVVFTAGKDDQFANQHEKRGHRLFSYYLIKGLAEGKTRFDQLLGYVASHVERESRKRGVTYTQEPQAYGNKALAL